MNKTFLIIEREFLTRVRKKSFIIMTILGPILFASFMIVPIWMATSEDKDVKTIMVADSSLLFKNAIPESDIIKFTYSENTLMDSLKSRLMRNEFYAILYIPSNILSSQEIMIYSVKQTSQSTRMYITNNLKNMLQDVKLLKNNIPPDLLKSIRTEIKMSEVRLSDDGDLKKNNSDLASLTGYASGFLVYFFVFLFGSQVMRGVIEEKTNRIVEVVVSSVRPFQLMMGKIVGIALVGLLQFILWIVLSVGIFQITQAVLFPELNKSVTEKAIGQDLMQSGSVDPTTAVMQQPVNMDENIKGLQTMQAIKSINFVLILGTFIFFFLGGYLLYAAMFAAIGSAVDNETDTQQFMLPVTIPLIIAVFVMIKAMQDPDSSIAFWFSIIPFTSPVVMMTRIPFGVAPWELVLSMVLLVITFLFMTWLAGKIYRTGILMYGKKVSWSELWKWLKYSN